MIGTTFHHSSIQRGGFLLCLLTVLAVDIAHAQLDPEDAIRGAHMNVRAHLDRVGDFEEGGMFGGSGFIPGSMHSEMWGVVHCPDVQKILIVGRKTPQDVMPQLRAELRSCLDAFPRAYRKEQEVYDKYMPHGGIHRKRSSEYQQICRRATAATDLLAELNDHNSLPLLVKSHALQDSWIDFENFRWLDQSPGPPGISLYAMHRLITTYPASQLDEEARPAQRKYIEWAKAQIRPVQTDDDRKVRNDVFRVKIVGGRVVRDGVSRVRMNWYPTTFVDGASLPDRLETLDRSRGREWFQRIRKVAEVIAPQDGV